MVSHERIQKLMAIECNLKSMSSTTEEVLEEYSSDLDINPSSDCDIDLASDDFDVN